MDDASREDTSYGFIYKRVATTDFEVEVHARNCSDDKIPRVTKERGRYDFAVLKPQWWKKVWRESVHEVKHAPWKWMGRRFCSHVLPVGAFVAIINGLVWMSGPSFESDQVCLPDTSFSVSTSPYDPWSSDSAFSIDIVISGGYTFGIAKLIDILWDVGVGRGGQTLLAFLGYQTFSRALTRSMEQAPVSHDTFKAITLQPNTLTGVRLTTKDLLKNRGMRAKIAMFWITLSGTFILSVPTWLSAMTGYVADVQPFVTDSNQNLVPVSDFHRVVYTLHDGDRVGVTADYLVAPLTSEYSASEFDMQSGSLGCTLYNSTSHHYEPDMSEPPCAWMWHVSNYTSRFGFEPDATDSTFFHPNGTVIELTARDKTLNISAFFFGSPTVVDGYEDGCLEYPSDSYFYSNNDNDNDNVTLSWDEVPYGFCVRDNTAHQYRYRTLDAPYLANTSSTLYTLTEIGQHGSCQQLSDVRYNWGFSFLLLYVFLVLCLIWTLVTFALYLDAYLHSRLDANRRHLGTERAVLDLAAAMRKKFGDDGHVNGGDRAVELEGDEQIRALVKRGQVMYHHLLPVLDTMLPSRWTRVRQWWHAFRLGEWVRAEKWWLVALLIFTVSMVVSAVKTGEGFDYCDGSCLCVGWNSYVSFIPVLGIVSVLWLGKGVQSRWLVFAGLMLIFVVLDIVLGELFFR